MIKISERLAAIASFVPNNAKILDVGCDHGLLDIYLFQNDQTKKIIASDVKKSALKNAIINIKKNNLTEKIETREGNGLDVIKENDYIDAVVLSGMGALTIIEILKRGKEKLKNINHIIVQSNTKLELLRKEIIKMNYYIQDEQIIKDSNKVYIIIKFKKGKKKYTKKEIYFGPILIKKNTTLFQEYKKEKLQKLETIKKVIPKSKIIEKYKINKEIQLYK